MQRFSLLLLFVLLSTTVALAQIASSEKTGNDRFAIKAQVFMGSYVSKSSNLECIDPSFPTGINIGIEFPSSQQRPWQQYLNNPTVGIGLSYINLGADVMGHAIAMYPYIMINGLRTEHFNLKVKLAAGLAAVSEWYYTTDTKEENYGEATSNTTFSTCINAYLSGGLNLEFPITRNLTLNGEFGFLHMSNGRTKEPNKGANILYGGVGIVAMINPVAGEEKEPIIFPDLPYNWSLNITASSGIHAADRTDAHRFLLLSMHVGAIYNTCNWHGIGLGADLFYNDAIGNKDTNRGMYVVTEDNWRRLRGGLSINNEFKFGRVTAMLDWGVYLFNPVRNLYTNNHPIYGTGPRPLFYKSESTGTDEAFHYIRFGVKYRICDNIYLQALAKTHMHICELIEFGVGYQIPFLKKEHRNQSERLIHHQRKGWWKNYQKEM